MKKAREVYFKYFPSQRMADTKATVLNRAMMGMDSDDPITDRKRHLEEK